LHSFNAKAPSPAWLGRLWDQKRGPVACKVDGYNEPLKVAVSRTTISVLVDAFRRDSRDWQGHALTVEIDKPTGEKFPLYLIPAGHRREEDENGYSIIVKKDIALDEEH
jgi:hypothetical protein